MAVYKVIQDVEAEDKLLGPLTLKGLVYAMIVAALGFINFRIVITTGLGPMRWFVILLLLMPMILFAVLASPLGRDQPTEIWLLSRLQFLLKSRVRIWDQSGITHMVTVTAPKRIEHQLTKNFNQEEVKSRLQALASTLDSRGWAIKNVNVNMSAPVNYLHGQDLDSDRLVDVGHMAQEVPTVDVQASDDILDEKSNPTAQKFDDLITQAANDRKQAAMDTLEQARGGKGYLQAEDDHPNEKKIGVTHKVVMLDKQSRAKLGPSKEADAVTASGQAVKLELANAGSDLSVASIASLANRTQMPSSQNEVLVALH